MFSKRGQSRTPCPLFIKNIFVLFCFVSHHICVRLNSTYREMSGILIFEFVAKSPLNFENQTIEHGSRKEYNSVDLKLNKILVIMMTFSTDLSRNEWDIDFIIIYIVQNT